MVEIIERKRLTAEIWEQMVERCNHQCLRCGAKSYPMSQDHVVPIERGGDNAAENIQPLCLHCNQGKATSADDYRPADWPWLEKPAKPATEENQPSREFLDRVAVISKFLQSNRTPDPRVSFEARPGDRFEMHCSACPETGVILTQRQINASVDNMVSEAHVAFHMARGLMIEFLQHEKTAAALYLPK